MSESFTSVSITLCLSEVVVDVAEFEDRCTSNSSAEGWGALTKGLGNGVDEFVNVAVSSDGSSWVDVVHVDKEDFWPCGWVPWGLESTDELVGSEDGGEHGLVAVGLGGLGELETVSGASEQGEETVGINETCTSGHSSLFDGSVLNVFGSLCVSDSEMVVVEGRDHSESTDECDKNS